MPLPKSPSKPSRNCTLCPLPVELDHYTAGRRKGPTLTELDLKALMNAHCSSTNIAESTLRHDLDSLLIGNREKCQYRIWCLSRKPVDAFMDRFQCSSIKRFISRIMSCSQQSPYKDGQNLHGNSSKSLAMA